MHGMPFDPTFRTSRARRIVVGASVVGMIAAGAVGAAIGSAHASGDAIRYRAPGAPTIVVRNGATFGAAEDSATLKLVDYPGARAVRDGAPIVYRVVTP